MTRPAALQGLIVPIIPRTFDVKKGVGVDPPIPYPTPTTTSTTKLGEFTFVKHAFDFINLRVLGRSTATNDGTAGPGSFRDLHVHVGASSTAGGVDVRPTTCTAEAWVYEDAFDDEGGFVRQLFTPDTRFYTYYHVGKDSPFQVFQTQVARENCCLGLLPLEVRREIYRYVALLDEKVATANGVKPHCFAAVPKSLVEPMRQSCRFLHAELTSYLHSHYAYLFRHPDALSAFVSSARHSPQTDPNRTLTFDNVILDLGPMCNRQPKTTMIFDAFSDFPRAPDEGIAHAYAAYRDTIESVIKEREVSVQLKMTPIVTQWAAPLVTLLKTFEVRNLVVRYQEQLWGLGPDKVPCLLAFMDSGDDIEVLKNG